MPILSPNIALSKLRHIDSTSPDWEEKTWFKNFRFRDDKDVKIVGDYWSKVFRDSAATAPPTITFTAIRDDLISRLDAIHDGFIFVTYTGQWVPPSLGHLNLSAIAKEIGQMTFKRGVALIQRETDDRPLYWARLWLRLTIKTHKLWARVLGYFEGDKKQLNVKVENFLTEFDEASRNLSHLNFVEDENGVSIPATTSRILLTGFDPYLASGQNLTTSSNFSGILALWLHGKTLTLDGGNTAYIQSCIFPTRYDRFDAKIVEKTIRPFIEVQANRVDLVLSTSLDPTLEAYQSVVERVATSERQPKSPAGGAYIDNNVQPTPAVEYNFMPYEIPTLQWIQTTLPKALIGFAFPFRIDLRQSLGQSIEIPFNGGHIEDIFVTEVMLPNTNLPFYEISLNPSVGQLRSGTMLPMKYTRLTERPILKSDKVAYGSGGAFLSNEIFYRIALLRERYFNVYGLTTAFFSTGHIHVPKVMPEDPQISQYLEFLKTQIASGASTISPTTCFSNDL